MNYAVKWVIENEVAMFTQYTDLSIEAGGEMIREISNLLDTSPKAKIPIIVDATRITARMHNVFESIKMFRKMRSDKWGFTIVIGDKGITKLIAQTVLQIARVEVRFAKNVEEALEILYRIEPDLPRVSPEELTQ
ncbi:MAG TPA: hypothetical protein PLZ51_26585 [Aggregatilineales bacterium]|nr:hypothetical protein [Aggregatilineales bacterium]